MRKRKGVKVKVKDEEVKVDDKGKVYGQRNKVKMNMRDDKKNVEKVTKESRSSPNSTGEEWCRLCQLGLVHYCASL